MPLYLRFKPFLKTEIPFLLKKQKLRGKKILISKQKLRGKKFLISRQYTYHVSPYLLGRNIYMYLSH